MNATETLQQKVERMNRESDLLARTVSFQTLNQRMTILTQQRLSCINGKVTLTPAEYSELNTRIQILGSAIAKQFHFNHP